MSKADFDKFIERQRAQASNSDTLDAAQQIQEWQDYLDTLYRDVESYMQKYIKLGSAKIEFRDIELNEEFSGIYVVRQMILRIGRSNIKFNPIGTMLIGSKGRVDVQGPRGIVRLGLVDKKVTSARQLIRVTVSSAGEYKAPPHPEREGDIEWAWKIISPAPDVRFIDLTEDTFFDVILTIADD
ncbi:hypothetical protein [Bosea sp. R86505]|uniref:hypothetical protein n=1 Tax=Bosea sp. R86505 TaxID=3101710 RepID=UPI00367215DB